MNKNKLFLEILYSVLIFFVMYGLLLTLYLLIENKENFKLITQPLYIALFTTVVLAVSSHFWPHKK